MAALADTHLAAANSELPGLLAADASSRRPGRQAWPASVSSSERPRLRNSLTPRTASSALI